MGMIELTVFVAGVAFLLFAVYCVYYFNDKRK
jgi:hypothetical protein